MRRSSAFWRPSSALVPPLAHADDGRQRGNQPEHDEVPQTEHKATPYFQPAAMRGDWRVGLEVGMAKLEPQMDEEQHPGTKGHIDEHIGLAPFGQQQTRHQPDVVQVEHHGHGQRRSHHAEHLPVFRTLVGMVHQHRGQPKEEQPCQKVDEQFPGQLVVELPSHAGRVIRNGGPLWGPCWPLSWPDTSRRRCR